MTTKAFSSEDMALLAELRANGLHAEANALEAELIAEATSRAASFPELEPGQSMPSAAALAFLEKAAKGFKGAYDADGAAEAIALFGWRTSTIFESLLLSGEQLTSLLRGMGILPPAARAYPPVPEFRGRAGENLECHFFEWHKHDLGGAEILSEALEPFKAKSPSDELGELSLLNVRVKRGHDRATVVVGDAYLGVSCLVVQVGKNSTIARPKISSSGTVESFLVRPSERLWKFLYHHNLTALSKAALAEIGADLARARAVRHGGRPPTASATKSAAVK